MNTSIDEREAFPRTMGEDATAQFFNIRNNRIEVDFHKKSFYSRSRNTIVILKSDLYFEFYEIGSERSLLPMNIEKNVSKNALENFLFLLTLDFFESEDYPIFYNGLQRVVENTLCRLDRKEIITPFKRNWPQTKTEDLFIFYGGGVDSGAVANVFTNAKKISLDSEFYDSYNLGVGDVFIKSNLKSEAFEPRGFVFWSQPFAVAPIISSFYGKEDAPFLLGSILGSSFLSNGKAFFNRKQRSNDFYGVSGNLYHSVFNELNLKLYAPFANCSELITTKLQMLNSNNFELPAFCQNNNGRPCLRCFKCFRKIVERTVVYKNEHNHTEFKKSLMTTTAVGASLINYNLDFSYFFHIWNFAYHHVPEISVILDELGFDNNLLDNSSNTGFEYLPLHEIFHEFEEYYQDNLFSERKLKLLDSLDIRKTDENGMDKIKLYKIHQTTKSI